MKDLTLIAAENAGLKIEAPDLEWAKPIAKSYEETVWLINHHDMWKNASPKQIHAEHIAKGYRGFGYGGRITQEGVYQLGRGYGTVGAHCRGSHMNFISFGLCYEGDFSKETMDLIQFEAGVNFTRELLKLDQCKIPLNHVVPHKLYGNTSCPGGKFPLKELLTHIAKASEPPHWGEVPFNKLNDAGILVREKRFDDQITRAETMALVWNMFERFVSMDAEELEDILDTLVSVEKLLS